MTPPLVGTTGVTGVGPRGWELRAIVVDARDTDDESRDVASGPPPDDTSGWTLRIGAGPRDAGRPGTVGGSGGTRDPGDSRQLPVDVLLRGATVEVRLGAPVPYPCALELRDARGDVLATDLTLSRVTTEGADLFADVSGPAVRLRRYDPDVPGPRPLIVFLHGGAEAGDDNWAQLVGTFGAVALAQRHPDHVVLAPQAPASATPPPPARLPFPQRELDPDSGWSRPVLTAVADHVRGLIAAGRVDPDRVLLTGVSMGGAGVLRMLDVAPELFAGAAPVCPTMTPETFGDLQGLPRETSLWVSSAYVDHTPDRHKYLVDGVLGQVRAGARDMHLTLFSPEQLAAAGIGTGDDLDTDALLAANHAAWVLTYSNVEGILDWLTTRRKDPR